MFGIGLEPAWATDPLKSTIQREMKRLYCTECNNQYFKFQGNAYISQPKVQWEYGRSGNIDFYCSCCYKTLNQIPCKQLNRNLLIEQF